MFTAAVIVADQAGQFFLAIDLPGGWKISPQPLEGFHCCRFPSPVLAFLCHFTGCTGISVLLFLTGLLVVLVPVGHEDGVLLDQWSPGLPTCQTSLLGLCGNLLWQEFCPDVPPLRDWRSSPQKLCPHHS